MRESYVRPVTSARERAPEWHAVWRFRAASLIMLALLAWVTVLALQAALAPDTQDPTSGTPSEAPASPRP